MWSWVKHGNKETLMHLHSFWQCFYHNNIPIFNEFPDAAYLHHWLPVTIHFNRYNLCFYKYTECGDKCKPLYFMVLHIRVVPPSFSHFVECWLSDSMCWMIGHFRMDVTERLLDTKVVVFLEILRFVVGFLLVWCNEIFDSLEKV